MNIAWVFSENTLLPASINIEQLKDIAPIWGSWKTQRGYSTDNVICHDSAQAAKLIAQGYNNICNLFINQITWKEIGQPDKVQRYSGNFVHAVDSTDDIVSIHLATSVNSVLLLIGFDFSEHTKPLQSRIDYIGIIAETARSNPKCQWVVVDHPHKLAKSFDEIPNITCDTLSNVLQLLNN